MRYIGKIKMNRTRQHNREESESFEKILNSDPYFSKDPCYYEEMEWYLCGNFTSVGKITSKPKAIRHEAQPC